MDLWDHQKAAISKALPYEGYLLAHDMGTGKTCTAINIINKIGAKCVLIMSPKSVVSVWTPEFRKFSETEFITVPLDTGGVKKKEATVREQITISNQLRKPIAVIVNYESAWRPPLGPSYEIQKGRNVMIDPGTLMRIPWDLVICDESHRIKGVGSKISWFCARLGKKVPRRLGLTGTPTPNDLLDLYAQFRFLDPRIFGTSFARFKKRYAVLGGFNNKQTLGFQNVPELNRKFYSITDFVKADEVQDLPETMHIQRSCKLAPKGRRVYDALEKDFVAEVEGKLISVDIALVKFLRLAQLAGGYAQLDDQERGEVIDNSKIETLADICEDLPFEEPIVVFCRFRNEIKRIKDVLSALGRSTAELSGSKNQLEEWKQGKFNSLVTQIQAGSLGVDMTRSRYCIFFSKDYNLGVYEQALKRTHRPGQTRRVVYYHVTAQNTADQVIYQALRKKKNVITHFLEMYRKRKAV